MPSRIHMPGDGILRAILEGDMGRAEIELFRREYTSFLQAATKEHPVNMIAETRKLGRLSSAARQYFTEINHDRRTGLMAIVNPPRAARVLSRFINKATGRNNIQFFDNEEDAIAWIREHSRRRTHPA
ncbi:MAG: STAS/SEC14 domain-containing protein [Chloroflexi bacterium]|nr:STAS/SEC14 domain-containing protein [Chloroflexota bacterium]